jgi:hypothetical protein
LNKKKSSAPAGRKTQERHKRLKAFGINLSHDLHRTVQCSAGEIDTRKITDESVCSGNDALLFTVTSEFCEGIPFQENKLYFHLFPLYYSTTIPHLEPTSDTQTLLALMTDPPPSPAPTNTC